MNAAADPKHRQLPLKYEVLHCLLAPSDVGGSLLHREQRGLNPADNRREFVSILTGSYRSIFKISLTNRFPVRRAELMRHTRLTSF